MSKISILCPYCFKPFDRTEVQMQCMNKTEKQEMIDGTYRRVPVCRPEIDKKFSDHWGAQTPVKYIFTPNLERLEKKAGLFKPMKPISEKPCPRCGVPTQRFVCPHCHNELPAEMIEKGSEIISVVGGPASGKSNYIVALIHELRQHQRRLGLNVVLQQVGRTKEEYTCNIYNKAEETIFRNKEALPKTQVANNPIPWIIRLESVTTKKAVYLVFYDTAGESFEDREQIAKESAYFIHSKAVIVAFDTLAIPKIQQVLKEKDIENPTEAYDYRKMVDTIVNVKHTYSNLHLTDKPYAFVFTKFDVVIDNYEALNCSVDTFLDDDDNFKNSPYLTSRDNVVSLEEMKECNDTIESYLSATDIWNEDGFLGEIENNWGAEYRQFFGVSALGGMTDYSYSIQTKGDEVKPIRVLDPLVWILIKLGGFGIKSK